MIVVILLGVFAMFFAWMEGSGQMKHGLKISFGLIFLFLALRYNYGSDYKPYLELFQNTNQYSGTSFMDEAWSAEPGWILLNKLCGPIGFFGMTILLAFINCCVYYTFFKKFVPKKYYWLAIFLYVFDSSYMLIHLTAMRQSLAILFFIFSLDYLYRKDVLRYVICIIVASFFHFSAIVLFLFILLGLFNFEVNKKGVFVIIGTYLLLYFLTNDIFTQINLIVNLYLQKYAVYEVDMEKSSIGIGTVIISFLFCNATYFAKDQKKEILLIFKIGILSFIIMPLTMAIPMISRFGMYFQPALLVVYPILISQIKNNLYRKTLLFILIFITLYTFVKFFHHPIWVLSFTDYHTIFSAPRWY